MSGKVLATVLAVILCICVAAFSGDTQTIVLGTSGYTLEIPAHFEHGEVSDKDIEEGQTDYYRSDEVLLDFDVYQLADNRSLAEFAVEDARAFKADYVKIDISRNIASYRSNQESGGVIYDTLSYVFGYDGGYMRVVFWLDGDDAEAGTQTIINSLKKQ